MDRDAVLLTLATMLVEDQYGYDLDALAQRVGLYRLVTSQATEGAPMIVVEGDVPLRARILALLTPPPTAEPTATRGLCRLESEHVWTAGDGAYDLCRVCSLARTKTTRKM